MNVMIDLETLSTAYNAAILSIGACKFDENGIHEEFYVNIDPQSCKDAGLNIDKETVSWWMRQRKEALEAIKHSKLPLKEALTLFSKWYGTTPMDTWGNGAAFDNVIIENAYFAVGMIRPWKYYYDRCFRTMKSLFPVHDEELPREGLHHNALHDAVYQAKVLNKIMGYS
jgi:hypothetical protein